MALVGRMAQVNSNNNQEQKKESTLKKIGSGVGNFLLDIGKSLGQTATRQIFSSQSPLSPLNKLDPTGQITNKIIPEKVNLPLLGETSLRYSSNPKTRLGQLGEDFLNISVGGGGGSVAKQVLKEGAKKTIEKATAKQTAKLLLKDAAIGSGYGVSTELQNKDAKAGDYARSAAIGGVLGAVLPPVVGKTLGFVGRMAQKGGAIAGSALEKTALKLEQKAALPESTKTRFYEQVDKPVQTATQKLAEKTAGGLRAIQNIPNNIQNFVDKYAPVQRFQDKAKQAGIETQDLRELVQAAPLRAGGKAEQRLDNYIAMRGKYGENWKAVKEYSHYLDDLDRIANDNKIASGRTVEDVTKDLNTFKSTLTPEQFTQVEAGQKELQTFLNTTLENAVNSGRLSQEGYNAIKAKHPNYIPHDVLDYLDDQAGQNLGKSFNMSKSGIEKAKGSTREIADIDEAVVNRLYRQSLLDEKNVALKAVIDTSEKMKEGIALRTAEQVKARNAMYEELNNLRNKQEYTLGGIQELKGFESKAKNKLKDIFSQTENKSIKELRQNISSTNKEMDTLFNEARTLSADFESEKKISAVLNKVDTREKRIFILTDKLNKQVTEYNSRTLLDVKQQSEALNSIRQTRKELQKIVSERQEDINVVREIIRNLQDTKIKSIDIPDGYEKISYFNDGIREDWLIPQDVGAALKNLDGEAAGVIMNWINKTKGRTNAFKYATMPAEAIRRLATGWNIVFSTFSNPVRDIQTVALTSDATLKDIGESLIKTITGKVDPELYQLAKTSGALQGTIFREGLKPEQILVRKAQENNLLPKPKISSPTKFIEDIGQKMEEMTRLAVFKRELLKGSAPMQAAKVARNATVDFTKSGHFLQVYNKFTPFINARVQGFTNVLKALQKDPVRATRVLMWTAAAPAATLNAYNSNYESYQNVPDNEKRKYWIIMVGESQGRDLENKPVKVPHYIKIPKGEAQQAVSNIVDRVLSVGKQKYPESTKKFLQNLFNDFSPVTDSNVLPTGISQAVELKTNYSLFRDKQIVPDYVKVGNKWFKSDEIPLQYQSTINTSEIAKALGESLGWSPIKIDYIIKQGLVNDLLRIYDIPAKGFRGQETYERASELPFLRTLIGSSSYGETIRKKNYEAGQLKLKNEKKIQLQLNKKPPDSTNGFVGRMAK